jgi:hypothetical protein
VCVSNIAIIASAPATPAKLNAMEKFVPRGRVRPTASLDARTMPIVTGSI